MSNRERKFLFSFLLAFMLFLAFLDNSYSGHKWRFDQSSANTNSDFEKYHSNSFTVTNVIDGDTLYIDCQDGQYSYTRIRLLGIDTPEINTESGDMYFAREASDFARKTSLGKQITIYLDEKKNTRDIYGRLLAYVFLPNGVYLNEIMLSEGFAYAYTKYRHSFYNKYNQLESRARSGKKGLWLNVTPEQLPQWLRDRDMKAK